MPTKLSNVRRRALASVLGIGLVASETSAFDDPVAPPAGPAAPGAAAPAVAPTAKDASARRASAGAYAAPPASAQAPGVGVYAPIASGQGRMPSPQGGPGMSSGGAYPSFEPITGMTPGMAGAAPGMAGAAPGEVPAAPGGAGAAPGTAPGGAGAAPGAAAPAGAAAAAAAVDPFGAGGGVGETFAAGTPSSGLLPNVIGDLGPGVRISAIPTTPGLTGPGGVPKVPPSNDVTSILRVFKIAENQSPRPQDRLFYTFNYFNNVNSSVNKLNDSPITAIKLYRHVFGFEKTFDEGRGSVGLSLPLYSQFANPLPNSGVLAPGKTALGDLNIFAKYILKENRETGSLISTGVLVTPPTGPRYLAGANYFGNVKGSFVPVHDLQIQPFLGYIFQRDRFYAQGFSALNVAVSPQDVSLYFNDVQFGYFVFRDRETDRLLTAIIPTFEAHITDPINHRGVKSPDPYKNFQYDPYGTPDTVNLTYGINFEFRRNSILTLAFAEPVTANRPFAYEAIVLLNYRFGRSRYLVNPPPNVIGG